MAIWQHQLYILPNEELESFFKNNESITIQDLDNIEWWKYRTLDLIEIDKQFSKLLNSSESWSKDLIIYGDNDADCIHIILEDNVPVEISARFDSRNVNERFVSMLVSFAINNDLAFLSDISEKELRIIHPNDLILLEEISENKRFNEFLRKLGLRKEDESS